MYTFTLSGTTNELRLSINPPIVLDDTSQYVMGLVNFETYYTIPNIEPPTNKFYIDQTIFEIPEGTYELSSIENVLRRQIFQQFGRTVILLLSGNNSTLRTEIKCNVPIDFTPNDSIRTLLGFKPRLLAPNKLHIGDYPARISAVNVICIDCNLISGSYSNNREVHILHETFPDVEPGYKIVDSPVNVIYLPVNSNTIDSITIKIVDQDGKLINFRGETITVRLHLKRSSDAP